MKLPGHTAKFVNKNICIFIIPILIILKIRPPQNQAYQCPSLRVRIKEKRSNELELIALYVQERRSISTRSGAADSRIVNKHWAFLY